MDLKDSEGWAEGEEWADQIPESEAEKQDGDFTSDNEFADPTTSGLGSQEIYEDTNTIQESFTAAPETPAIGSQSQKSMDDDYWNDDGSTFPVGIVLVLAIGAVGLFYFLRGRSSAASHTPMRAGYRPVPGAQAGPKSHTK